MARVVLVLAATLLFALLGLLAGHLSVHAMAQHITISGNEVVNYYLWPTLIAGVIGFGLSVYTIKLFGSPNSKPK